MVVNLRLSTTRNKLIRYHFREIDVDGVIYQLEFFSDPSFEISEKTIQLYMQVKVPGPGEKEVEVYTLKSDSRSRDDLIAEHIIVNTVTKKTCSSHDNSSLQKLVNALYTDQEGKSELIENYSFDSLMAETHSTGRRVSDWELINRYLKHLY
ncbi:MAG: hypothetical protein V1743_02755 [Nanoarchaeota archaeon]